jgi:hypothetical protein
MTMADIKAKLGGKLSAAEQKKIEAAKVGRTRASMGAGGATGQALQDALVLCPYCGAGNWIVQSTTVYNYYQCWNCYGTFAA